MSLKFTTLEYAHLERSNDWYWVLGIVTVAVGAAAIILGNTLFGIVILMSSFGITLYAVRKPKEINVEIDNKGIKIDKNLFPHSTLQSFCITKDSNHERLRVRLNSKIMPMISIILSGVSAESVEEELSQHVPQEEFEISTLEKIMETFGL